MKLKELLKHHNIDWPSNATHVVQDKDGWIKFAENSNIKLLPNGCWDRGSCPQSKGYVVPNLPLASDWDTAIVAKQNWIQITKEQIKSIPVGSPIRVGGEETLLSYHYRVPTDYGFDTEHEIQKLKGSIFGNSDWDKNIKVEVLMNQGHPHAKLMLQYAQDAMTTSEPWKLWQVQDGDFGGPKGEWSNLEEYSNLWIIGKNYRRKPITKLIHGVEVPDIIFTPEDNEYYFYPDPTKPRMYEMEYFHKYAEECEHRLTNKMCYPTTDEGRQAAILHAKAMLGVQS